MAETTGVSNSTPNSSASPARGGKKKQNRLLLYGGIAAGGLLLMSHRGAQASQTDPNAQLDASSLAAENAALLDQSNANAPGGFPPVDTGGGSYTTQGPSATVAPGPVSVTVNNFPAKKPPGKPPHRKPPGHKPPPKKKRDTLVSTTGKGVRGMNPKSFGSPKPKQGHKTTPHPANKNGKHPDTPSKTPAGYKKNSPAEVESIRGSGSGAMVMGREFPGALAHRMGAPRIGTDGTVTRTVTVDYGGRTDTHLVHNNGERWTDNAPGASPPSRGVPRVNRGVPV